MDAAPARSAHDRGGFPWRYLPLLVVLRLVGAVLLSTSFNPDEYWQGLEPAHHAAFGYGYLTWEWQVGLRSWVHPLMFMGVYKALALFGLDGTALLIYAPKLLNGVVALLIDIATYHLSWRMFESNNIARTTLLLSACAWFHSFCTVRSLANSLETLLVVSSLASWPSALYPTSIKRAFWSLLLAALAVVVRPTAAIFFLGMLTEPIVRARQKQLWSWLAGAVFPAAAVAVMAMLVVDRLFYGRWHLAWLVFLRFNVLQNLAGFYGTHPWHWYLTQGFPMMFGVFLPFVLIGIYRGREAPWRMLFLAIESTIVFSCLGHKEPRFLLPLLPVLLPYAAVAIDGMMRQYGTTKRRLLLAAIVLPNAAMALYFGGVHQRGVLDVMWWLRDQGSAVSNVLFLLPCHSTPYQAYLHRPDVQMRFLTCEPPKTEVDPRTYVDEADAFFADPAGQLSALEPVKRSHIVLFEPLLGTIRHKLLPSFVECARFFNSHFADDNRKAGELIVLCNRQ